MVFDSSYIVGLTDGEGSFSIAISILHRHRWPFYQIIPRFRISLNEEDELVLHKIKRFFSFGRVSKRSRSDLRKRGVKASDASIFNVAALNDCDKIVKFFKKNQLETTKKNDFNLWSKCITLMLTGKHKAIPGFLEIAKIRDDMNIIGKARAVKGSRYREYQWFKEDIIRRTSEVAQGQEVLPNLLTSASNMRG